MKNAFRSTLHLWLPLLIGGLMLPAPLLRDFHIESALIVALAGCFWAAWSACRIKKDDWQQILFIFKTLYLIGVPLFIYAVIAGCLSWHGIGFWILYPVPSVLFGYSIGRLLRVWNISYRRLISCIILFFIAVGVLLIEFFNLPQVYFFNHVWGGWPGPIYDETVNVTWGLVFFRGLTMAWIILLWWLPAFYKSIKAKTAVIVSCLFLIAGYSQLAEIGIISPRSYLQEQLGGFNETPHFNLYYDENAYTEDEINFIAKKHEFYFKEISEQLELSMAHKNPKIESYLYAHPWQKKLLVGAKFTSYVPVWLKQDQLHIAKPQIESSLKHELIHVLSKEFGNSLFNASWSIGLIEGLAVAVAPNASEVSTINQIVVSEKPYPTGTEMQQALTPTGFYGGRSTVNYTQSGSFVQYLLTNYPVQNFKEAYPTGDISKAYETSFESLINEWHAMLDTVTVDSTDRKIAKRLYSFPSLFEQKCPHIQTDFAQFWDRHRFYIAENDTLKALKYLNKAYEQAPENLYVKNRWAFLNLKVGNINRVQQEASLTDSSAEGLLLYADAFAMAEKMDSAQTYIAKAETQLHAEPDSLFKEALRTRQDTLQWKYYRSIIYDNKSIADSVFITLFHRTQVRAVQQAIDHQNWPKIKHYANVLVNHTKEAVYFDSYIRLIEKMAYYGEDRLAHKWLNSVKFLNLRPRYQEKMRETQDLSLFFRNDSHH